MADSRHGQWHRNPYRAHLRKQKQKKLLTTQGGQHYISFLSSVSKEFLIRSSFKRVPSTFVFFICSVIIIHVEQKSRNCWKVTIIFLK